jgi:hypothetical protein
MYLVYISESDGTREGLECVVELIQQLVTIDAIRAKSWMRRLHKLQQQLKAMS